MLRTLALALGLLLAACLSPVRALAVDASPAPPPAVPVANPVPATGPDQGLALPAQEPAEEPAGTGQEALQVGQRVWQTTWESLSGQTLVLGAGYEQGTLKFLSPPHTAEITDNGRLTLLLRYETQERYVLRMPLRQGQLALGYDFIGSYGTLHVDRQLVSSAFVGQNLGTSVKGDYLVGAPQVFLRMGPLYPGRDVFWKFSVGLGGALVRLHGNAQDANGNTFSANTSGLHLDEYLTVGWELEVERWLLIFKSLYLAGKASSDRFTYEVYALSLGYAVRF